MDETVPLVEGIQRRRLRTDRLEVELLASGGDTGPCVMFVHGNVSSALFWQETMLGLPAGWRAIAPDLRGFGGTEALAVDAGRGLRDYADDLAALVRALDLPAVHLVGWSMGGGVVLQYLVDHPTEVATLTLINPVSPYGFGGTKGLDGGLCQPDGAGSGGGTANPEFVQRLADGDRGADQPNSPRNVLNAFYFKPPFHAPLEDVYVQSMLSTHIGEDFYPGDAAASQHWPGIAPGRRGVLNTMSPVNLDLSGVVDITPKPPILWVRGADDLIVSDSSMFDLATLGQLGHVPDWPGPEVFPPQPMVAQTRAVLDRYRANGGCYTEVAIDGAGHGVHLEAAEEFSAAFLPHFELTGLTSNSPRRHCRG